MVWWHIGPRALKQKAKSVRSSLTRLTSHPQYLKPVKFRHQKRLMELHRIRSREPVSFTVSTMRMQKKDTLLNTLKCLETGRSIKMDGMQELFTVQRGTKHLIHRWRRINGNYIIQMKTSAFQLTWLLKMLIS